MLVLRPTDKVPCKIDGITFWVSPLSLDEKLKIHSECPDGGLSVVIRTIQESVSRVDGIDSVEYLDGTTPKIDVVDGKLTEESVHTLIACVGEVPMSHLSAGVLTNLVYAVMPGVEVDLEGAKAHATKKKKHGPQASSGK